MPSERAFGGMSERNSRAGFERREKGLKVTRTSVRNRVIMFAAGAGGWDCRNLLVNALSDSGCKYVPAMSYAASCCRN
jgi:hypothetical protein